MVKGRGSKQKGSRLERDVRDLLKKIYPVDRRDLINRVPMSGAGWMKGDVIDMNNTDWSYEVKNQETLALPEWWRQTKVQARSFQTPCLVFSSNFRPIYWVVKEDDWRSYERGTLFADRTEYTKGSTRGLYDKLAKLGRFGVYCVTLDGDDVVIVPTEYYLEIRMELARAE